MFAVVAAVALLAVARGCGLHLSLEGGHVWFGMKTSPSLVDHGFMDARSKLLDVAAFLDRVERHGQAGDFRVRALCDALPLLASGSSGRVRAILESLSDTTVEPIPAAAVQGAAGAWKEKYEG